jgi:hypothetical protein
MKLAFNLRKTRIGFLYGVKQMWFALLFSLYSLFVAAQSLTSATNLNITKTWWQAPNGHTYAGGGACSSGRPAEHRFFRSASSCMGTAETGSR